MKTHKVNLLFLYPFKAIDSAACEARAQNPDAIGIRS